MFSLYSGASFDFAYSMNTIEFAFSKNFNSKVNCTFNRDAASMVAPDKEMAEALLAFARYDFDLAELYARKFRKKLFEEKDVLSEGNFYQSIYNDIKKEHVERHTTAGQLTNLGMTKEKLQELHQQIRDEIQQLADYCKTCKPIKKK